MAKATFEGVEVQYDPAPFFEYRNRKAIALMAVLDKMPNDHAMAVAGQVYLLVSQVLLGKDEEVAEQLGADGDKMFELLGFLSTKAAEQHQKAKN